MSTFGKTQLQALAEKRLVTFTSKSGLEFTFRKLSGKQRDSYNSLIMGLGNKLKAAGLDITKNLTNSELAAAGVTVEAKQLHSQVLYLLISMSVLDGDQLPTSQQTLWTPEQVGDELENTLIEELAAECERINGLGQQENKIEKDFTKPQS